MNCVFIYVDNNKHTNDNDDDNDNNDEITR